MPELPDLQVFSANLHKQFAGSKLKSVSLVNKRKSKVKDQQLKDSLEGQVLTAVLREGKELRFHFNNKCVLGLHLMLRGQLHIFENQNDQRFAIIELLFTDGKGLAMSDFQGQANATLNPVERDSPDALSKEVTFEFLKTKFESSKATVKSVLMDQDFIRGIGNAYADEILWDCRISPFSVCQKIPDKQIRILLKSVSKVLREAEKKIQEANPDLISGEVRDFMLIHHPDRKESPGGEFIECKMLGGRKTYFTKEQVLYA